MEYLDAIAPALTVVIAYLFAGTKNADRDTVPGAARAALVRLLDGKKTSRWSLSECGVGH